MNKFLDVLAHIILAVVGIALLIFFGLGIYYDVSMRILTGLIITVILVMWAIDRVD